MIKEKKSFFEKISGDKKTSLKVKDANEYSSSFKTEEDPKEVQDGQLAVDVYEIDSAIVVRSIIGGVKAEDIEISAANDVLTIKGVREKNEETETHNYFVEECFWGAFSRSIILPVEVDAGNVKATMKNGILKIILPRLVGGKIKKIKIEEE